MKRVSPGPLPLISLDRRSRTPLYRQVYRGFRDAILERRLRAGQRIPSTRSLAVALRISRFPILDAYEQLLAEGYFESRVGSGTFVASLPSGARPPVADRPLAPPSRFRRAARDTDFLVRRASPPWLGGWGAFRVSEPAVDRFPHRIWSRLVGRHGRAAREDPLAMKYGDPMGHRPLREAVAEHLRTARGARCEADHVMIVSGSQQALTLTARVLVPPGARVWVEDPGYGGARDVLRLRGARLVPVPVDEDGLDVAAGVRRAPRAAAAYVTPSHQYPLGMVMSVARRLLLLEWARRNGSWIIEDDYDSDYRYESLPIASLQGLDRDARVLYVGTFSKVLFPALRVGYLVVPPDLAPRFAAVRDAMDIFPSTFVQEVLAEFIRGGHFARHLRRMGTLYRERRRSLVDALHAEIGDRVRIVGDEAGMHLTAALPDAIDDGAVAGRAARRGLWVMPLSSCSLERRPPRGLVLGFGSTDASDAPAAVRRLGAVLAG